MTQYALSREDATQLTVSRELADYFEAAASATRADAKTVANWITGDLSGYLNKENMDIADSPVGAGQLAGLTDRIHDKTISGKIAKEVFEAMWHGEGDADDIIDNKGLKQITDTGAIEKIIDEVLMRSQQQVEQYKSGQAKVFGYFVGQVMQDTKGKANPQQVNEILKRKLDA
jgi:aspartyl-tRNA(Asn)/glutamyl-tRNA(Gln) amidotransferase subunit B